MQVPTLLSVSVNPTSVTGGAASTGTISVYGLGYTFISLSSSNPAVQVPSNVGVGGNTTTTFPITTSAVSSPVTVTITATESFAQYPPRNSIVQTATLTVNPNNLASTLYSVVINPVKVVGGHSATATVLLSSMAPSGGVNVKLAVSNNALVTIPSQVFVAQGQTTANFPISTQSVSSQTTSMVTATYGSSISVPISVIPVPASNTYAYVANSSSATISVVDIATSNFVATIPVAAGPASIAVSPNASTVYVSCSSASVVDVIQTSTNSLLATLPVGTNPQGIAVSPDGLEIAVANSGAGTVSLINTATNSTIATVSVGTQPYGVTYSLDGRFIYVSNSLSNSVSVIDSVKSFL